MPLESKTTGRAVIILLSALDQTCEAFRRTQRGSAPASDRETRVTISVGDLLQEGLGPGRLVAALCGSDQVAGVERFAGHGRCGADSGGAGSIRVAGGRRRDRDFLRTGLFPKAVDSSGGVWNPSSRGTERVRSWRRFQALGSRA